MYNPTKPYKDKILSLIKKTWQTRFVDVKENIYPVIRRKFNYSEIDHTDGIGTKGVYHWQKRTFKNAVLDALAMNLNDLAMARAAPYKLQNHILLPRDDLGAILKIIGYLSKECLKRKIAITGGETSIQNTSQGLDISLTVSGFIKKPRKSKFRAGDILIGLKSNGLHSNGFTKVREVFKNKFWPEFVTPTKIYWDIINELGKKINIHGMMHITGGAFTKLKQALPVNCGLVIQRNHRLKPQKIFFELYHRGVSNEEMYKTFNCGVGFIFSIAPDDLKKIKLSKDMAVIGHIIHGSGKIKIESIFSDKIIEY